MEVFRKIFSEIYLFDFFNILNCSIPIDWSFVKPLCYFNLNCEIFSFTLVELLMSSYDKEKNSFPDFKWKCCITENIKINII